MIPHKESHPDWSGVTIYNDANLKTYLKTWVSWLTALQQNDLNYNLLMKINKKYILISNNIIVVVSNVCMVKLKDYGLIPVAAAYFPPRAITAWRPVEMIILLVKQWLGCLFNQKLSVWCKISETSLTHKDCYCTCMSDIIAVI